MRIAVRRSGGVAGITRTGTAELDPTGDPEVSDFLTTLQSAASASTAGVPDSFVYHVRIDGGAEFTVDERDLPKSARQRIHEVLQRGSPAG